MSPELLAGRCLETASKLPRNVGLDLFSLGGFPSVTDQNLSVFSCLPDVQGMGNLIVGVWP